MRVPLLLRRRSSLRVVVLLLIGITCSMALACDINKIVNPKAAVGADSLKVAISRDTALAIHATTTLKLTPSIGTIGQVAVRWSSSAPGVAAVDSLTGVLTGNTLGNAVITAKVYAPELGATVSDTLSVRVRYAGISIKAVDSLTSIGQKSLLDVRGTDIAGVPIATIPATIGTKSGVIFATRDASVVDVDTVGNVIAVKSGASARVVVTYQGMKDSTTVKVRQVTKAIAFPSAVAGELAVQSLNLARTIPAIAKDALTGTITGAVVTWSSSDTTTVKIVASTGALTALKVGTATVSATADGFTQTIVARVTQVVSKLDKTAGDAQSSVGGTTVSVLPRVTALDSGLTPVPSVPVSFVVGVGGGSVTGGSQTSSATGQANVGSWTLGTTAGANTLVATSGGAAATFTATATSGVATKLIFVTSPASAAVGAAFAPPVTVAVADASGNVVTTATNSITVSLASGTGTLGGTLTATAVSGVATFPGLTVSAAGTFTMGAATTGLTSATSGSFAIFGAAAKLAFTVQPSSVSATAPIAPAIKVTVQDAAGATVLSSTASVTLAIGANPGAGLLGGTVTASAVAGVATFSNISVSAVGTGYTLTAAASSLTGTTSAAFNITAIGPPATLAFLAQPGNVVAGATMAAFTVAVTDAGGAVVTSDNSRLVTISLPGVSLGSGTATRQVVNGVATFNDIVLARAGTGFALSATAAALSSVPAGGVSSAAFTVSPGAVSKLAFVVSPSNAEAGGVIAPAVQVGQVDAFGNVVTAAPAASITLALTPGAGASGASLAGTTTALSTGGVATFGTLSVATLGTGYSLTATASALTSAVSGTFNVVATGLPVRLAYLAPPTGGQFGTPMPAVRVAIQLADGTTAASVAPTTITLAFASNPGGATLTGATATTANGIATFSTLAVDKVSAGYQLVATAAPYTSATSAAFSVTGETQLLFTVQPTDVVSRQAVIPAVKVAIADASGATVPTATQAVTLGILTGTGKTGALVSGTKTVSAVAGVATFSDIRIDSAGAGFKLQATASNLTSANSAAFAVIAGAPRQLVFQVQPQAVLANQTFPSQVRVFVADSSGNLVTTATSAIALGITSGSGTAGAVLTGTVTVNAVAGVATFPGISVDRVGANYTLTATASALTSAVSTTFSTSVGTASKILFQVNPSNALVGVAINPPVKVMVTDAAGNLVPTGTNSITVTLTSGTAGAVLGGTKTVVANGGVASFGDLTVDRSGTGYVLTATTTGLATNSVSGTAFSISGVATKLAFSVQPSTALPNGNFSPAVTVTVTDAGGTTVGTATSPITIAITAGTGTAGATVVGTRTVNAVAGVATFTDIKVDKAGAGYTFTASATGLTAAVSNGFTISVGPAAKLVYITNPASTTGGTPFSPTVQVGVVDSVGNLVTSATNTIFLTIGSGTGSSVAVLTGTSSATASGGVAIFPNLAVDRAGTGYQLVATASFVTAATSPAFNVTVGASAKLAYLVQPTGTTGGVPWSPTVQVAVTDLGGNTVTSATDAITVAATSGAALNGTKTVNAVAGVASFPGLGIDAAGTTSLLATASGLASATSNSFPIAIGPAAALSFFSSPMAMTAAQNATWNAQIVDLGGNRVTSASNPITIAIAAGTGTAGAVLSGTSLTISASGGVASFPVQIDKAGAGYQLSIASTGLTTGTSSTFAVNAGVVSQVVFGVIPKATFVNAPLNPDTAVTIRTLDAGGNPVPSTDNFSLQIVTAPGGAVLSGISFNAVAGVATVPSSIVPNTAGATWQIRATDNSRGVSVTSPTFSVAAFDAPTKLGLLTQPPAMQYLVVPSTAPVVAIQDKYGNTVTTSTDSISATLSTNPGTATLGGAGARAVAGVATLSKLTLDQAGTGYVITTQDVTTATLTSAVTNAFNVSTPGTVASTSVVTMTSVANALYWTDGTNIKSVSMTGGTIATMTGSLSTAGQVVSDGVNLYWSETGAGGAGQGKISKMPIGGGTVTPVASGFTNLANNSLMTDGTNLYFVAQQISGSNYAIKKVAVGGGTVTDLVTLSTTQPTLTVAGSTVFYSDPVANAVKSVPVAGGAPATVSTGALPDNRGQSMRVIGSTLYFAAGAGVQSVPTAGGSNTVRATTSGATSDLTSDGTSLFFADQSGAHKMNLSTFAVTTPFSGAGSSSWTRGLVTDASSIYAWIGFSSIQKAPK